MRSSDSKEKPSFGLSNKARILIQQNISDWDSDREGSGWKWQYTAYDTCRKCEISLPYPFEFQFSSDTLHRNYHPILFLVCGSQNKPQSELINSQLDNFKLITSSLGLSVLSLSSLRCFCNTYLLWTSEFRTQVVFHKPQVVQILTDSKCEFLLRFS